MRTSLSMAAVVGTLFFFSLSANAQELHPDYENHPSVDLPAELDRILRDYEAGWKAGDAAGLATLFSEDGFALPSSRHPFRGHEAIEAAYAGAGGDLTLRALAFQTSGDVGFIVGAYSYKPEDGDSGKFVLAIVRSDSGRWLIAADIDNGIRKQ